MQQTPSPTRPLQQHLSRAAFTAAVLPSLGVHPTRTAYLEAVQRELAAPAAERDEAAARTDSAFERWAAAGFPSAEFPGDAR